MTNYLAIKFVFIKHLCFTDSTNSYYDSLNFIIMLMVIKCKVNGVVCSSSSPIVDFNLFPFEKKLKVGELFVIYLVS